MYGFIVKFLQELRRLYPKQQGILLLRANNKVAWREELDIEIAKADAWRTKLAVWRVELDAEIAKADAWQAKLAVWRAQADEQVFRNEGIGTE